MFDPRPAKQADKRGASEASERPLEGEAAEGSEYSWSGRQKKPQ